MKHILTNRAMKIQLAISTACTGIAILALSTSAAIAQEAENNAGALEEIMVTAQRREENLQTTPLAVSAVTSQMIENNRIFNVFDLASSTPSFSMTANTPLDLELNIRGVTNTRLDSPTADPSVGMFVDDVYIGRTGDINVDFFDIDRIEVIRGPQGVLLGKNVVGGALSVYTKQPEFEKAAQVMVSLGNYDSVLVNGFATGQVAESLAGRFSFQRRSHDGYGYDLLNDRELDNLDSTQFRGQLLYQPDDGNFTAKVIVDYSKDSSNGITVIAEPDDLPAGAPGTYRPWSTLRAFVGLTDPRVSLAEHSQYAGDDHITQQYFRRNTTGVSLDLNWAFEGMDLTSITSYRDVSSGQMYDQTGAGPDTFDQLYNFADFQAFAPTAGAPLAALFLFSEPVREDTDIQAYSQEIRLTSNNDSRWDWIVGAYYKHDEVDKLDRFIGESITGALPTLTGESHWDNRGTMSSIAGFAQLGFQISDAWKATIGGRYTKDDKDGFVDGIQVATGDRFNPDDLAPLTPLTGPFSTPYGDTWSEFTPQGIIEFQPSDNWYWYGSISTGFKGGGYEDTPANATGANFAFDPELVTNYEIGFKATLMEGRMRLNATTFFMDYEDLQVQQTNQDCLCNITDNASNAEIKGLEAELQWAMGGGFILFAGGSLLQTEYIDFIENSGQVSSGNHLQRTPENQLNVGFDWSFGKGRFADAFSLNASYYWQDMMYWQPSNANTEDAYSLINARLSYEQPGSNWMASVWIKNVTDELYRTNIIPFFGEEVGQYGAPQTYGVDFRVNF